MQSTKTLTCEELFSQGSGHKIEAVTIEDLGQIHVRSMTLEERSQVVSVAAAVQDKARPPLDADECAANLVETVMWCACNPDGSPMFAEEDRTKVEKLRPAILNKIAMAANKVSGLTVEEAKKIEKKSATTTRSDSSTD